MKFRIPLSSPTYMQREYKMGIEKILEKIMAGNFPNPMKNINFVSKKLNIPSRINTKTHTKTHAT